MVPQAASAASRIGPGVGRAELPPATLCLCKVAPRKTKRRGAVTSYCASYEVADEGQEAGLLAALAVFEDRCHALPSLWFICTPWTPGQIRAYLGACLGPGDSLVVEPLPVGRGWSGFVKPQVQDWLLRHLGPSS